MQRARRWAVTGGLTVSALVIAIVMLIGISLISPNTLKPLAESITERALGRPLQINGDLGLELSMTPAISVTDARLGNAPGATAPYMITAGFVRVQLDLAALFDNRVHLLDLQARETVLYLEDSVDGPPNWQFFDGDDDESGADPWSFMIQQAELLDCRIHAAIGELHPIELTIPRLEETSDANDHLNLNGLGELNGRSWRLSGRIGPFSEMLLAGRIDADVDLTVDAVEIDAQGTIGNLATLTGLDLRLAVHGPEALLLGEIFRMPESFAGDVALDAEIRPTADGHATSMTGHVSDFTIETAGTITDLAGFDGWDGSVHISGPDLGVAGKALQIEGFPDGPFDIKGLLHRQGGDLDLHDVTIRTDDVTLHLAAEFEQFPSRQGAWGTIRLSGADISEFRTLLRSPSLPAMPFDVRLSLAASGAEDFTATVTVGRHTLDMAGTIGEFPDLHGTELQSSLRGEDIATLLQAFSVDQPLTGPYEANAGLHLDENGLHLKEGTFTMAGHAIEADLHWPDQTMPGLITVDGRLSLDNLSATGALFGFSGLPEYPTTSIARLRIEAGKLTLEESRTRLRAMEIQADGIFGASGNPSDLQLNLGIQGPRVSELFDDALADSQLPFNLQARIRGHDETLEIDSFALATAGGTFNADGTVALSPGLAGSRLRLEGGGDKLSLLLPAFPYYVPPDHPWQLNAEVELTDTNHVSFRESRLQIGSINVQVDGILDIADQSRTTLTFAASGDRISDIGRIGDVPWPDHPFDLSADLAGTLNTINIQDLEARWGDSDLAGNGKVLLIDRPFIEVHGHSNLLDIYDLQHALFGAPEDIEPEDDGTKVFPDTPVPMDMFAGFDAIIDVQVDRFRGQRTRLEDISLQLNVEDGVLHLDRAAYRDEIGHFDASALLRPQGDGVYLELALTGEDVDVGLFTSMAKSKDRIPRYTLDVDIWGNGKTVADLAGGLNGTLLVSSDGGEIDNGLVETLGGDFLSNVLETLNPFVESEPVTKMDCLVLNASIIDGRLKMAPGFVMRTDRLNMFVYGSANLETEILDLSLATQARRGIGISAATITNPYFKVGGTLASPALELDPANAAIAASVATATAGLSILVRGVFDRLRGTQNPCPNFLEFEQKHPVKAGETIGRDT